MCVEITWGIHSLSTRQPRQHSAVQALVSQFKSDGNRGAQQKGLIKLQPEARDGAYAASASLIRPWPALARAAAAMAAGAAG
eukprot:4844356-Pleurochrysis_carterae.AAC.2